MNESNLQTYYYIPNAYKESPDISDAYEIESNYDIVAVRGGEYDEFELRWLVEDMAKDFFDNHDGWEISNSWHRDSRDFAVWDKDKNFIGTFEVQLEYEPIFSAWRKQ